MENSTVMKCHGKMCNFSVESNIRSGLLYSTHRRDHNLCKKKQIISRSFKEIREDKSGLGHIADRKEKLNMLSLTSFTMHRTAIRRRKELSDLKYDYARVQRACQYFDSKDGLRNPLMKWFWPRSVDTPKVDEDKIQSDSETGRKSPLLEQNPSSTDTEVPDSDEGYKKPIELLTGDEIEWRVGHIVIYLRTKYNFCIWCGFQYDDEKDMEKMCPGRTRQDHDGTSRHVESDHYDSD